MRSRTAPTSSGGGGTGAHCKRNVGRAARTGRRRRPVCAVQQCAQRGRVLAQQRHRRLGPSADLRPSSPARRDRRRASAGRGTAAPAWRSPSRLSATLRSGTGSSPMPTRSRSVQASAAAAVAIPLSAKQSSHSHSCSRPASSAARATGRSRSGGRSGGKIATECRHRGHHAGRLTSARCGLGEAFTDLGGTPGHSLIAGREIVLRPRIRRAPRPRAHPDAPAASQPRAPPPSGRPCPGRRCPAPSRAPARTSTGCAGSRSRLPLAARPMPPATAAARSVRMSPNRLSVTMTS